MVTCFILHNNKVAILFFKATELTFLLEWKTVPLRTKLKSLLLNLNATCSTLLVVKAKLTTIVIRY